MNWFDSTTSAVAAIIIAAAILAIIGYIWKKRDIVFGFFCKCYRILIPRKPTERELVDDRLKYKVTKQEQKWRINEHGKAVYKPDEFSTGNKSFLFVSVCVIVFITCFILGASGFLLPKLW